MPADTVPVRPDARWRLLAALDRLTHAQQDRAARSWPTDAEMERMIVRAAEIPSARSGGRG